MNAEPSGERYQVSLARASPLKEIPAPVETQLGSNGERQQYMSQFNIGTVCALMPRQESLDPSYRLPRSRIADES
jgi:hypothetical protein